MRCLWVLDVALTRQPSFHNSCAWLTDICRYHRCWIRNPVRADATRSIFLNVRAFQRCCALDGVIFPVWSNSFSSDSRKIEISPKCLQNTAAWPLSLHIVRRRQFPLSPPADRHSNRGRYWSPFGTLAHHIYRGLPSTGCVKASGGIQSWYA